MKDTYSFLKDDLAVIEIRKHQWIESQKQGREIGFASAAIDWVKKHGESFKHSRLCRKNNPDPLLEKRQHRRFPKKLPLRVTVDKRIYRCHTDDINLVGLSCTLPDVIADDATAHIAIQFPTPRHLFPDTHFTFQSRVTRITDRTGRPVSGGYRVFLPFSEDVRDYLRNQAQTLALS